MTIKTTAYLDPWNFRPNGNDTLAPLGPTSSVEVPTRSMADPGHQVEPTQNLQGPKDLKDKLYIYIYTYIRIILLYIYIYTHPVPVLKWYLWPGNFTQLNMARSGTSNCHWGSPSYFMVNNETLSTRKICGLQNSYVGSTWYQNHREDPERDLYVDRDLSNVWWLLNMIYHWTYNRKHQSCCVS